MEKLVNKGIVSVIFSGWKFVSNVFVVPKPNDKFRLLIDISPLNTFIQKTRLKMDNLDVAVSMMFP